jgi:hypothetical protein
MTQINRRRALAVVAAVPAAVTVGPSALASVEGPSELAALVRRYFEEVETFCSFARGRTDKEADAFAARTYERTRDAMVGVPVRSADDAIAVLDFFVREEVNLSEAHGDLDGCFEFSNVVNSMLAGLRGYIAGRVA